ncbi:hypothetical protein [Pseudoduganella sp. RAF53_2]|uniref:hypothetical protein n=1 Tax=unclassified Pseudoduganella TaxID=2637179 RepID=UPI003F9A1681
MTQRETEWFALLQADVQATGSVAATAQRVGVSRGALSAILNQTASSPYVNGKSGTAKIEARILNTIGRIECPFLTVLMEREHRITGLECREHSSRETPPTNSPRAMSHWRACQNCEKRVPGAAPAPAKQQARIKDAAPAEPPQQAGIIDKVTLPLPEVGGPQVETAP